MRADAGIGALGRPKRSVSGQMASWEGHPPRSAILAASDVLTGFAFSLKHAEELGIEERFAVLVGASAGGHLAALATFRLAREPCTALMPGSVACPIGLLTVNARSA